MLTSTACSCPWRLTLLGGAFDAEEVDLVEAGFVKVDEFPGGRCWWWKTSTG